MNARPVVTLIALVTVTCACNSKTTATPDWTKSAQERPAPAAEAAAVNAGSPKNVRITSILVRQESSRSPIAAEVYRQGDSAVFVVVGDSGQAAPNKTCTSADMFTVTPRTAAYLQIEPVPCAATLDFELPSAETTYALVVKADDAFTSGNFAVAQQYYSIAAQRLKVSQPAESTALMNKAHIAAGRALQISAPTVNVNGTEKLSVEAQGKLKEFQSRNGLPTSGALDAGTAQALSGVSKAEAIKSAAEVPSNRVQAVMRAHTDHGT